MNAYELAEFIETGGENIDRKELSNMLRQQADRIAELEKQLNLHKNAHHKCVEMMQAKQSEPVAWMQMHHKDNIPTKFSPVKVWEDDIPLYTTPQTKPLSDEEICNLWLENSYGLPLCNIAFEYARAIEERHGIK